MPSAVMVTGREARMGPPLWTLGAPSQGGILPVRPYFTPANPRALQKSQRSDGLDEAINKEKYDAYTNIFTEINYSNTQERRIIHYSLISVNRALKIDMQNMQSCVAT